MSPRKVARMWPPPQGGNVHVSGLWAFPASPVGCSWAPLRCGPFGTAYGPLPPPNAKRGSARARQKVARPSPLRLRIAPQPLTRGRCEGEGGRGSRSRNAGIRDNRNAETWTFPRYCNAVISDFKAAQTPGHSGTSSNGGIRLARGGSPQPPPTPGIARDEDESPGDGPRGVSMSDRQWMTLSFPPGIRARYASLKSPTGFST